MVRRSLGSGMTSRAVFQKDLPSLGMSEKLISASCKARNRFRSVDPFVRVLEVDCVSLPFIPMSPPGRNNPAAFAAHNIYHYDLDALHEADGQHAVFAMAAPSFLEDWSIEDLRCV